MSSGEEIGFPFNDEHGTHVWLGRLSHREKIVARYVSHGMIFNFKRNFNFFIYKKILYYKLV